MKKQNYLALKRLLSSVMLVLTVMLCTAGCAKNDLTSSPDITASDGEDIFSICDTEEVIRISVDVINDKGVHKTFNISTDADNLGDALVKEGLVEGEYSQYGLYITSVNGLAADYSSDKAYWAITKDGEYLMTGADSTPISDGDKFELTYTKD